MIVEFGMVQIMDRTQVILLPLISVMILHDIVVPRISHQHRYIYHDDLMDEDEAGASGVHHKNKKTQLYYVQQNS